MNPFGKYSKYYDLLYHDKDYLREVEFISKLLDANMPNGLSILELGCGTGRHAAILAENKWFIDGIDISIDMLKAAESRKKMLPKDATDRLKFIHGDIRNFDTGKQYDVILSLFHVVSYLNSNKDISEMFDCVKKHLKPGGIFIFDYWYGPAVLSNKPMIKIKRINSLDFNITRLSEPTINPNTSLVDINYEIQIYDNNTQHIQLISEKHCMRYFFLNEIEQYLNQAGLNLLNSAEWLTGEEPGWNTWGVYSIAS